MKDLIFEAFVYSDISHDEFFSVNVLKEHDKMKEEIEKF